MRPPARPGSGPARAGAAPPTGPGRRPSRASISARPAPETDQVERLLVRLVRDPQAAAGVDQPKGRAGRQREPPGGADSRRDVRRRAPRRRGCSTPRRRGARAGRDAARPPPVAPNPRGPPRPSRTCRPRRRRRGGLARVGHAPRRPPAGGPAGPGPRRAAIRSRRASSPGDSTVTARIPARTAARELVVALARAGHHDAVRGDPGPAAPVASSPPDATSAPSPSRPRKSTTASAGFALTA